MEEQNFTALYERYYHPVRIFIAKQVRNQELAEDLTQDAFFNVYRHKDTLTQEKGVVSYLFVTARNLTATYFRNSDRLKDDTSLELAEDGQFAADPSETYSVSEPVRIALARMSKGDRSILVQTSLYGYSQRGIARAHNCSTRTVRNRLSRAHAQFIQAYEQEARAS